MQYLAKLEEEQADTKSQEIRKQVKHLKTSCTSIVLMASQLSKTTVMASAYKESGPRKGGGKGVYLGSTLWWVRGPMVDKVWAKHMWASARLSVD